MRAPATIAATPWRSRLATGFGAFRECVVERCAEPRKDRVGQRRDVEPRDARRLATRRERAARDATLEDDRGVGAKPAALVAADDSGPTATSSPVSSRTSRTTASSSLSPALHRAAGQFPAAQLAALAEQHALRVAHHGLHHPRATRATGGARCERFPGHLEPGGQDTGDAPEPAHRAAP